jgi:hypothetical protein
LIIINFLIKLASHIYRREEMFADNNGLFLNDDDQGNSANCSSPAYANTPGCNFEDTGPWRIGLGVGMGLFIAALLVYVWRRPIRHALYPYLCAEKASPHQSPEAEMSVTASEADKASSLGVSFLNAQQREATSGMPLMKAKPGSEDMGPYNAFA